MGVTTEADFVPAGRGFYSPREAARLTDIPLKRLKRWTLGYWYTDRGKRHWSDPIVGVGIRRIGTARGLDFCDLMEARFLNAFRDYGVGWHSIRLAAKHAREILNTTHPFSSKRFSTDGRTILARIVDPAGDPQLLDLVRNQYEFDRIVIKFLRGTMEYGSSEYPEFWSPLGADRQVILHPAHAFGAPIVVPDGVRTRVLFGAFKAEQDADAAASWYGVSRQAVLDAVEFESSLSKAA